MGCVETDEPTINTRYRALVLGCQFKQLRAAQCSPARWFGYLSAGTDAVRRKGTLYRAKDPSPVGSGRVWPGWIQMSCSAEEKIGKSQQRLGELGCVEPMALRIGVCLARCSPHATRPARDRCGAGRGEEIREVKIVYIHGRATQRLRCSAASVPSPVPILAACRPRDLLFGGWHSGSCPDLLAPSSVRSSRVGPSSFQAPFTNQNPHSGCAGRDWETGIATKACPPTRHLQFIPALPLSALSSLYARWIIQPAFDSVASSPSRCLFS
jgi:hypothetical protein